MLTLYFISAEDDDGNNHDAFVRAAGPQEAAQLFLDFYKKQDLNLPTIADVFVVPPERGETPGIIGWLDITAYKPDGKLYATSPEPHSVTMTRTRYEYMTITVVAASREEAIEKARAAEKAGEYDGFGYNWNCGELASDYMEFEAELIIGADSIPG